MFISFIHSIILLLLLLLLLLATSSSLSFPLLKILFLHSSPLIRNNLIIHHIILSFFLSFSPSLSFSIISSLLFAHIKRFHFFSPFHILILHQFTPPDHRLILSTSPFTLLFFFYTSASSFIYSFLCFRLHRDQLLETFFRSRNWPEIVC